MDGHAEREAAKAMIADSRQANPEGEITLGADKGYDAAEFIKALQDKSNRKSAVPDEIVNTRGQGSGQVVLLPQEASRLLFCEDLQAGNSGLQARGADNVIQASVRVHDSVDRPLCHFVYRRGQLVGERRRSIGQDHALTGGDKR